jgi:hypothetical protein
LRQALDCGNRLADIMNRRDEEIFAYPLDAGGELLQPNRDRTIKRIVDQQFGGDEVLDGMHVAKMIAQSLPNRSS